MADITEVEQWDDGVYQLETTDPVQGGVDGIDNLPHKHLANRTKWLKSGLEALQNTVSNLGNTFALLGGSASQRFKVADAVSDDEAVSLLQLSGKANLNGNSSQYFKVNTPTDMTHATSKAYVDGLFGNIQDFGNGQSWQDVTSNRNTGVTYTNTTGKPIAISITFGIVSYQKGEITVDSILFDQRFGSSNTEWTSINLIIPNGVTYRASTTGYIYQWRELR